MTERHSLREIWEDLALPELASGIRIALGPAKLMFAFCGVLIVCSLGLFMDWCAKTVVVVPSAGTARAAVAVQTELDVYLADTVKQTRQFVKDHRDGPKQGLFSTLWHFSSQRFHDTTTRLLDLSRGSFFANVEYAVYNLWLSLQALIWAFRFHPFYSIIYFTVSFLTAVFVGGGICRCAALEFAHDEKPGLFEAFGYTRSHYGSYLSAPLLPLGLVVILTSLLIGTGLLACIPRVGELIFGVFFGIALLCGFVITLLLMGMLAGGILLLPAISYEKSSGKDAIGRAFHYVLGRPAWMCFYVLTGTVLGTFFYLIIRFIFFLSLKLSYRLVLAGMKIGGGPEKLHRIWSEPEFMNFLRHMNNPSVWSESITSFITGFFMLLIVAALLSCVISYFFCSSTIIYALMRKKIDNVETGRVYKHLEQVKVDAF